MGDEEIEALVDDLSEEVTEKVMDNDDLTDDQKKDVLEGITDALQFRTQHWSE